MINYNFPIINIDPIIFSVGYITFRWYGLMYLIGFFFAVWFAKKRSKNFDNIYLKKDEIENILYFSFLGLFLGGRLGYVLFYNFSFFLKHPLNIFKIWEGGMSFHGGLIGVIIIILYFSKTQKKNFFQIADFIAPLVPVGLGLGRLGNFINGELWGRVTSLNNPLAMLFPQAINQDLIFIQDNLEYQKIFNYYNMLPRHPSQLYEFFLEGLLLFVIMNVFISKSRPIGSISGLFLISYGIFRIIVEFFREPDIQLGFFYNFITMGQILSIPMIIIGIIILIWTYFYNFKKKDKL